MNGQVMAVLAALAVPSSPVALAAGAAGHYVDGVLSGPPPGVLELLGVQGARVTVLRDVLAGKGNWLVDRPGQPPVVLRRYRGGAVREDFRYEHAVLRHLTSAGWVVPEPIGDLTEHLGWGYCLTRYVPGAAVTGEGAAQQHRRGADLARLHLALRPLGDQLGQRPGWQPQHLGPVMPDVPDWAACVHGLAQASPRLGAWAQAAEAGVAASLAAIGAADLPVIAVHGDFAEWNVHYQRGRLAGVVDFDLTHLDSRPYELAIARTYRAPHALAAYRAAVRQAGWPLSDLEEAAMGPVYRAFRVAMLAWQVGDGLQAGRLDLAAAERQLSRTGIPPP
jgi:Ser/Thr protein kinase RdoA (MazF antagonist)